MKRAGRDEQHMIRLHRPVLGRDGGAFNQRQQITLHPFAGNIATTHPALAGACANLVNLIQKHDAIGFNIGERFTHYRILIQKLVGFILEQRRAGFGHRHLAGFAAPAEHLAEHVL